jgi:uncharacterized protein (TIGR02453 family)
MAEKFAGYGQEAVDWFIGLERDNSKSYFTATRSQWETHVLQPLTAMLESLALEFGGTVRVFRQNRDVRFSRDKSPYKTTTYGVLERSGSAAGLYAQISAAGLYAATGYHEMASDQLERFREAIAHDKTGAALVAILHKIHSAGLTTMTLTPPLKTAPRSYPRDHPRVELLRQKDLVVGRLLPPGAELASPGAQEHVAAVWRAGLPLGAWLDKHVGESDTPPEVRYGARP